MSSYYAEQLREDEFHAGELLVEALLGFWHEVVCIIGENTRDHLRGLWLTGNHDEFSGFPCS